MTEGETPDRYIIAIQGDNFLVVDMPRKGIAKFGKVMAVCESSAAASKITVALAARFPPTDAEDIA